MTMKWPGTGRAFAAGALTLVVLASGCCSPVIHTDRLPAGRVGEYYHMQMDAECWEPFWWMTGELPVGMTFDSDGVLRGTPRYAGLYFITIGFDDYVDGEIMTSVSTSYELLIVEAREPIPEEWDDPGAPDV